jgi:GNAT superfamily N-acetyltransferase
MKIVQSTNEDPRHSQLVRGLIGYNESVASPVQWEPIVFFAEDEDGNFLGGLEGNFEWDYFFVKRLWVAEQRKGVGTALMQAAENLTQARGKRGVWLDTYEFQAKDFYEKLGYRVFGTIPNAADESSRYFLHKVF